jgi:HSP20 family protein
MTSSVLTGDLRQTFDHFRRSVDQLFENFYGYPVESGRAALGPNSPMAFAPAVETAWTESSLHMRVILPGVTQENLKVTVQNNQLIIEGERKIPEGFEKNSFTQLSYGKFYTAVTLPSGLELDKVNCQLHDGLLDIQIPVAEKMKPRQVQIQAGEGRRTISASH